MSDPAGVGGAKNKNEKTKPILELKPLDSAGKELAFGRIGLWRPRSAG
jgi:hypothetical protein